MSRPTISTIIPAYRAAGTISRALESVLRQTRPPTEIVVVDDGSPDDLTAALGPNVDKLRVLRKANGGAASARNFGIAHSTGELLAFLDADDYWEPQRLERQLEVLQRYPEVGLVASRFYLQEVGRPRFEPFPLDAQLFDHVQRATGAVALSVARRTWTSSVLLRRSVLGAHRFDESLRTAEDVELWLRLALEVPVFLTSEPLATGVQTPGSLSRSDVAGDYQNMLRVVQRNAKLIGRQALRTWELSLFRDWAAGHLGRGEPWAALRPARERLRRQPWSPQGWWILCKSAMMACFSRPKRTGAPRSLNTIESCRLGAVP